MKTKLLLGCLVALAIIHSGCNSNHRHNHNFESIPLPDGFTGRTENGKYKIYTDTGAGMSKNNIGSIKSIEPTDKDFATILNSFDAKIYLNKRIQYTAYVKSKNVTGWAGLWMRVDAADPMHNRSLAFDNMQGRAIKGTTDWTKYSVVLDVSREANEVYYGVLLADHGQIWIDSINLKVVGDSVPVTDMNRKTPGSK